MQTPFMTRLFLDISTSSHLRFAPPNKFTRMERRLADALGPSGVELVHFDSLKKEFVTSRLPEFDPSQSFGLTWTGPRPQAHAPNLTQAISKIRLLTRAYAKRLASRRAANCDAPIDLIQEFANLMPFMSSDQRKLMARALNILGNNVTEEKLIAWINQECWADVITTSKTQNASFEARDCLLLVGASWCHIDFDALTRLKRHSGLSIVGFIFDLIPVHSPAIVTAEQRARYLAFLTQMATICDGLLVPSSNIATDLVAFLERHGAREPRIEAIPLCGGLNHPAPTRPSQRIHALGLEQRRFVLTASPLRHRKNQLWAFELWKKAHNLLGAQAPALIFAGPLVELNILSHLTKDKSWKSVADYLSGPSDEELAWLYEHAQFSIYPSLITGLGMPILESIERNCPCICATDIMVPEALQGYVFNTSPSESNWLGNIVHLSEDRSPMPSAGPETTLPRRTWDDIASEIREFVDSLARAKAQ